MRYLILLLKGDEHLDFHPKSKTYLNAEHSLQAPRIVDVFTLLSATHAFLIEASTLIIVLSRSKLRAVSPPLQAGLWEEALQAL